MSHSCKILHEPTSPWRLTGCSCANLRKRHGLGCLMRNSSWVLVKLLDCDICCCQFECWAAQPWQTVKSAFCSCIYDTGPWVTQIDGSICLQSLYALSIPEHMDLVEGDTPVLHAAGSITLSAKGTAAKIVRSPYSICSRHISERGTQLVMCSRKTCRISRMAGPRNTAPRSTCSTN